VNRHNQEIAKKWLQSGQRKIVLRVDTETELTELFHKCEDKGIPCELIKDAGYTQLAPGTMTCFGAGPWLEEELDALLGHLKLL